MWSPGAKAIPNPHAATQKSHRVARKKMPAMTPGCSPGSAAAIVQLDGDHLSLVLAELWKSWAEAPKAAAVSKAFNRASKEARVLTKSMDIAVVRMPLAANESLNPKISEAQDNALIESWGKTLENYAPHGMVHRYNNFPGWCTGAVEKSDMTRVLDMGQGWLTNFAIDAFYKTLMPALEDAKLGDENIFMYGASSWTVEREGVLGYVVERVEGTVDTVTRSALLRSVGVLCLYSRPPREYMCLTTPTTSTGSTIVSHLKMKSSRSTTPPGTRRQSRVASSWSRTPNEITGMLAYTATGGMSVEVTVPECLRVLLSSFLCVPWDLVVADPVLVRVLADSAYRRYLTRGTSQ